MPSAFTHYKPDTPHKGSVVLAGSFRPNGSSAPTVWRGNWIEGVSRTGTGAYTITIKERFRGFTGLFAASLTLQMASSALSFLQLGAVDLAAGTIAVRAYTESTGTVALADIASNAGNWIHIALHLREGTAEDGSGF